ncbi:MAG: hypothetical protein HFJ01_07965 [Lachnospiraceae bacterium]|jgi:GH25 family lysozyme M1 (1,4-beta-N-acetylmuramidase)|nr:hypothetical protein [Lachnospiraceae bacterium]
MGKFFKRPGGGKRGRRRETYSESEWMEYDENYEEDEYEDGEYEDEYDEDEEDYEEDGIDYEYEDYEDEEDYETEEDYDEEDYETEDDAGACEEEEYEGDDYEIEYDAEEGYEEEEDYGEEYYEEEETAEYETRGDYSGEDYGIEDEEEYESDEDYYGEDEEEEYYGTDEEYYAEDDEIDDEEEDYGDEEYDGEDEEDYEYGEYDGEDEEDYEYGEYDGEDEEDYEYGEYDREDEEDYEYGEYDEVDYEEDYEDDEIPEGAAGKIIYKLRHMSVVDHVVALTGAAVFVVVVITGALFFNAKSNQSQIEAFAEIGVGMEDISMIGESGLVAVADAQTAKYLAATMEMEDEEEEAGQDQEEETEGKTEVVMNLTSIQKDLKIKFLNKKTGKLIPNLNFKVEITKPSGGAYTAEDDDKDGIIYQTGMEAGKYKVKITGPASDSTYAVSSEQMSVTVKDTIEYKKVDVSDEVKTEAQVNAAAEDTKVNETVVESTNKDTVEWVESTKTLIDGTEKKEESYEKVEAKEIADPGKTALAGFRLLVEKTPEDDETPTPEPETPSEQPPTPEPTQEPTPEPTQPPTPTPVSTPEPAKTPEDTPEPTRAPETAPPTAAPTATPVATPSPSPAASASPAATPSPLPTASASPTATPSPSPTASASPTATPNDAKNDTKSVLKTTKGETLYIKNPDGTFREAKYADYYTAKEFYRLISKTSGEYKYTGWQVIEGVTYFFDKNGDKVTGEQVIQGAKYNFNSDGSLNTGSGHMGIDVSKWNGNIDWNAVKNSGVSYVIIRCGYRGSSTGALIEDPMFRSNIQGASKAGLKVGVYFFTQAVNEVEAVEEASMVLGLIKGYGLSYPVFLDVEASNGRADAINASTRTAVCKAFCQTIQNSGYKAGIYANKTWLNTHIDAPSLTGYKIWLAQYAAAPSYNRTRYDMWQYSSKGSVSGIKGNVDMNISYMGY